ncbi:MAG TPA: SagB family peptide dehydrogenase [Streptosporangiaceae bacterium]|jgi:SagB-type dehydrogenase family enzyme
MESALLFPARAIRLHPDATVVAAPDGLAIAIGEASLPLPGLPPQLSAALQSLAAGDVPEAGLQRDLTAGGMQSLLRWQALVTRLDTLGLIERSVLTPEGAVARLHPVPGGRGPGSAARAADQVKLSRFTIARVDGGRLVAERPGSHARVELAPGVAGLLASLAGWTSVRDGAAGLSPQLARAVTDLLAGAGLLAPGGPGDDQEEAQAALAQWTPADLWLHATSRGTRRVSGYGGSYPLAGRFAPLPAVRPAHPGQRVELPRPDLEVAAKADPPLTEVLEKRRSTRAHDAATPITLTQLGELLYRSARIRRVFTSADGQEVADRPYPGGGSVHELEIYPLITTCAGAPPGLWHYAAADHALERVAEPGPATAALVAGARGAAIMNDDPQVVLIVTARFGRVMWKYHAIGYSLVLKHVGVLYQTIYLVASAMGLGVCGLGGGDASDFAAASGLPYHAEGSVGELVIGTPAHESGENS